MPKKLKQLLQFVVRFVAAIAIFIAIYFIAVFILYHIPVNSNPHRGEVQVYIKSNGVHTDIVVPVKNDVKDWTKQIGFQHTIANDSVSNFVAFGWGDKGFYLHTPQWKDLKTSTAFKAAFYLGTSAMHTQYYKTVQESNKCVKLLVTKEDYADLVQFIEESFSYQNAGKVEHIKGFHYNHYDAFYEAKGRYSLFYTCNTWANSALKAAHQKAALWTPYDGGILYHYGK